MKQSSLFFKWLFFFAHTKMLIWGDSLSSDQDLLYLEHINASGRYYCFFDHLSSQICDFPFLKS